MWNGGFIEKDRRIYPFRACKCWACNYPYNRGVVSKLEPLKWFNSAWIGPGICEDVYTWGAVEWVFNHGILEASNSRAAHVEHCRATRYRLLIRDCSLVWAPPTVCVFMIFRLELLVCFIDWPHYCYRCWWCTTTSVCFTFANNNCAQLDPCSISFLVSDWKSDWQNVTKTIDFWLF